MVASKDTDEVDNTYFLVPVKILDHEGPLSTGFPIENRHLPQGKLQLQLQLQHVICRNDGAWIMALQHWTTSCFLVHVKILDHAGPLSTGFPIENRHLPQGKLCSCSRQLSGRHGAPGNMALPLAFCSSVLWLAT